MIEVFKHFKCFVLPQLVTPYMHAIITHSLIVPFFLNVSMVSIYMFEMRLTFLMGQN